MESYIEIELENFQRWSKKTIRLHPGINLINGKSGTGKSTICRAIYFVLYGGRKHKNIGGKGQPKTKRTYVSLTYVTPEKQFYIYRERPTERVRVEFVKDDLIYELEAKEADEWISTEFGTEESWISSSYLAQEKDHFFIRENNSEKKELIRQITFGDLSSDSSPEFFINTLSPEISSCKARLEKITAELNTRRFIINDIVEKTPDVMKYGYFSDAIIKKTKKEIQDLEAKRTRVQKHIQLKEQKRVYEGEIGVISLSLGEMNIDECNSRLAELDLIQVQNKIAKTLSSFDTRILTMSISDIEADKNLYNDYIRHKWKPGTSLEAFLAKKKEQVDEYHEYLKQVEQQSVIEMRNKLIEDENEQLKKEYLSHLNEYKRYLELKERLQSFEPRVLSINSSDLFECKRIYEIYSKYGYTPSRNIHEFLKEQKDIYTDYLKQQDLERENRYIQMDNEKHLKEYSEYNKRRDQSIVSFNEYSKQRQLLDDECSIIESFEFYEVDETDDMSCEYLTNIIQKCNLAKQQLMCPCCNHGLILHNGILIKGESSEIISKNLDLLKLAEEELVKRKARDAYVAKEENFNLEVPQILPQIEEPVLLSLTEIKQYSTKPLSTFDIPEFTHEFMNSLLHSHGLIKDYLEFEKITLTQEPHEPDFKAIIPLKKIHHVAEPKLFTFIIPTLSYEDVNILSLSIPLMSTYDEWKSNPYSLMSFDEEEYSMLIDKKKEYERESNRLNDRISMIQKLGIIDDVSESDISVLNSKISELRTKIEIGKVAIIYQEHCEYYEQLEEEQSELVKHVSDASDVVKFIQEIANSSIDDMILSINNSLEIICEELFDRPISVVLSSTKELKNGNEKNDINLEITYGGDVYDISELSGGEKKRVSLALLLSLMAINVSPICIMDEVLPSMESDLKILALNSMSKFAKDKFIIHICHDICIGHHDYVIDILEDGEVTVKDDEEDIEI